MSQTVIHSAVIVLFTSCSLAGQCRLPEATNRELHQLLTTIPDHRLTGRLSISFVDRGEILLLWVPSVQTKDSLGQEYEMVYVGYLYPGKPRLSWFQGWNKAIAKIDFITQVNRDFEERRNRQRIFAETPPAVIGESHPFALTSKPLSPREEAIRKALDVKYPACSMRPVPVQRAPELNSGIREAEICTTEIDWSDVQAFAPVKRPPSPSSDALKGLMIKAIVRAVVRASLQEFGRNRLLVDDFNVDDDNTAAVLISSKGEIGQRFGIRLDKNDPCLADAQVISGGCSPCPDSIDVREREHMIQIYP